MEVTHYLMYSRALRLFFVVLIWLVVFLPFASSGTLEDIRNKTGSQPAADSSCESSYCHAITPAELTAHMDKYCHDKIKMQVLFNRITTSGLNKWIGENNNRHMWPSRKYIAFRIKDPHGKVLTNSIYLFLNKNNSCADTLVKLPSGARITIAGFVRDVEDEKAWIDVQEINLAENEN